MEFLDELHNTVRKICTEEKGILAADESTGTIGKRLASISLENTLENRINYRKLLFNTNGLENNISGVITYEETLRNSELIQPLLDKGIVVGIKTDLGAKPLYGTNGETVTQGIDNLDKRCNEYYRLGARFAKWRAILKISDDGCPSELSIKENAMTLARYASISQNHGLVPIVEPEILMDGNHSIMKSKEVTQKVLSKVYQALVEHNVVLSATLLKPNMVRPGVSNTEKVDDKTIAQLTVETLFSSVPPSVPGIVFLSGGMSEIQATNVLNHMFHVRTNKTNKPWYLSFSYGRALQASVLKSWMGKPENVPQAQQQLLKRAKANGLATIGKYLTLDEYINELNKNNNNNNNISNKTSLHVENYSY
jgi:fructose-bisphosphate aldolase, class I